MKKGILGLGAISLALAGCTAFKALETREDELSARLKMQASFEKTLAVVNAADYGFLPSASALENHDALQKALDGGNRKVVVRIPGDYRIEGMVCMDDDTVLEFAPGVVIHKNGHYAHVLVNRGAFQYSQNRNIILRGLNLSVKDSKSAISGNDTNAPGMRGQVAFYNIKNIQIYDFTSTDNNVSQYTLQVCGFDGFLIDGFTIRGEKDGIHLNAGLNFVIRNGTLRTADDGIALNAGDWPVNCTPVMGSLVNGLIENVEDEIGGKCNFARVITGVWGNWHAGMMLHRGDMVNWQGKTYAVNLERNGKEVRSETPPTHAHGVWTSPEGIPFLYLQEATTTRADILKVTFRNIRLHAQRSFGCFWELSEWSRLIHPEIPTAEYPVIDITLEDVVIDSGYPLVNGGTCGKINMRNVRSTTGPLVTMCPSNYLGKHYPIKMDITMEDCTIAKDNETQWDLSFQDAANQSIVTLNCRNCNFERELRVSKSIRMVETRK